MGSLDATEPIPLVDTKAEFAAHGKVIMDAMEQVAQSGSFILGPQVAQLEHRLAAFVQTSSDTPAVHCVGVSDGTAALQLCLMALRIGPGHEVVTVPFTWISSAEVIPLVGAKPVFVDVEPESFVMDAEKVSDAITANTRAIITVSLFGIIPDLTRLREVIDAAEEKHGTRIALIEDGAQSFGGVRKGFRSCGSPNATLSTTSFFPTKPLSCYGDGGAVFTRDEQLADTIRALRVHGKVDGRHVMIGLNARLDTIQAAVLLTKMDVFDDLLAARRKAAERYTRLLQDDGRIILPTYSKIVREDGTALSAYGLYTILVEERDSVLKKLHDAGISCAVYYRTCCHEQPVFGSQRMRFSVAEGLCRKALSLPMHPFLTEAIQLRVVRELRTAMDDLRIVSAPV